MKPSAYISDGGILFKESPPDSMIKLTPLYAMRELTDEEILLVSKLVPIDADTYDLQEFARAILRKASEK
jgi:hypothetical protein